MGSRGYGFFEYIVALLHLCTHDDLDSIEAQELESCMLELIPLKQFVVVFQCRTSSIDTRLIGPLHLNCLTVVCAREFRVNSIAV